MGLVATVDLVHKTLAVTEHGGVVIAHDRPPLYVAGGACASLLWAVAVVLARSDAIAVAGGVLLGGAAGNLVSFVLWPSLRGVPDPIVAHGVAFNVADGAVALGLAVLLPAAVVFALRNRERLSKPIRLFG
jgi:lipoprotein signal peptidase